MAVSRRSILAGLGSAAVTLAMAPAGADLQLRPLPGIIRLRANENPYGPSRSALEAAARAAARGAYYPGPIKNDLLNVIAARNGLSPQQVVLSSGSNEALCAASLAWGKGSPIVAPALTYSEHLDYARQLGVEIVAVPLRKDLSIDLGAMLAAARKHRGLVYICNPNNPTGLALDGDELRGFCQAAGEAAVVLVDEAYNELTDDPDYSSMIDLVREGRNVMVMRTFSKLFGMAGMRIGYTMAPPELAAIVAKHVMSWPNVVGIAAALASYEDQDFIRMSRARIGEGRSLVVDTFRQHGIEPLPSQTNFVYADIRRDANEFARRMEERNVLIRGIYPPYDTYTRVSMGKIDELREFARIFGEVYGGQG